MSLQKDMETQWASYLISLQSVLSNKQALVSVVSDEEFLSLPNIGRQAVRKTKDFDY